jgi:hypothetical protein
MAPPKLLDVAELTVNIPEGRRTVPPVFPPPFNWAMVKLE